jgi:hypothetical protein
MPSPEVLSALETLHKEIDKLQPAIRHVEAAVTLTQTLEKLPEKHLEFLDALKDRDIAHKDEIEIVFKERLNTVTATTEVLQKAVDDTLNQISTQIEQNEALLASITEYYTLIKQINFPERLDKLDSTVAGIMAAVQVVQSRLDNLERNIVDDIKELRKYQEESRTALENNLAATKKEIQTTLASDAKKQQTFTYITWGLIVIGIVAMLVR